MQLKVVFPNTQSSEYRALEILGPDADHDIRVSLAGILVQRALEPFVGTAIPMIPINYTEHSDEIAGDLQQWRIQPEFRTRLRDIARSALPPECQIEVVIENSLRDGRLQIAVRAQ